MTKATHRLYVTQLPIGGESETLVNKLDEVSFAVGNVVSGRTYLHEIVGGKRSR